MSPPPAKPPRDKPRSTPKPDPEFVPPRGEFVVNGRLVDALGVPIEARPEAEEAPADRARPHAPKAAHGPGKAEGDPT